MPGCAHFQPSSRPSQARAAGGGAAGPARPACWILALSQAQGVGLKVPTGILRAGLAFRRKNLRPPQQPGGFGPKPQICGLGCPAKPAQQAAKNPGGATKEPYY
jgi:hypothetical protein